MNDYISKPVDPRSLSAMIEKWLPSRSSTPSPQAARVAAPTTDLFDRDGLLDRLTGDEDLAREIIDEYLTQTQHGIAGLKRDLDNGDAPLVRRGAHTIKGASATVGAVSLQAMAGRIEMAAATGDLDTSASLIAQLDEQLDAFKLAVPQSGLTTSTQAAA